MKLKNNETKLALRKIIDEIDGIAPPGEK